MEPPLEPWMNSIASSGVMMTPSTLEAVAATMAAGMLPPASEVNVIDDCTVDGTRHRKIKPIFIALEIHPSGMASSGVASSGYITKVIARIVRWSFQCLMPATVSSVERRAP